MNNGGCHCERSEAIAPERPACPITARLKKFWGDCFAALATTAVFFGTLPAHAQVANDNIENRRLLQVEEVITSNTTGCTVQHSCVNERLTGKCIDYHNDQWFEFRPAVSGTY